MYDSREKFTATMTKQTAPTLLVNEGNCLNEKYFRVEGYLEFLFAYGIGSVNMDQCVRGSVKECIKRYKQISMPQLIREEVTLVS